ncbi:NF038122 family metalloprotease [Massilia sp. YIM B04103]|uniref:NF038122 family metalloprotease n=1 Tax=Massilia sp. YIM B04103 TaxID=2963106 RepID=UPI002109460A|nr:NF038122 family metalloprotease [Massilia sp. YIM B04103]
MKILSTSTLLAALCGAATCSAAPHFNLTFLPGTSMQAQQGFIDAAARWSSLLRDDVSINLTLGFNPLDPGILGQARSAEDFYNYHDYRAAMLSDISSASDRLAVNHLPLNGFGLLINRTANNPHGYGSATPYVDNNGSDNNRTLFLTQAQAKALKLPVAPQTVTGCIGACDGFIQFSSNFKFDFNPRNGIDADAFDFVGVASHEIGHTLGFISGVDILDNNAPPHNGPFDDNEFTYVSGLDMFRYSSQSHAAGVIDWTADAREKYFSLDGGATQGPLFSTGANFGDGRQASHWKDNLYIGLMDPTAGRGELLRISDNDRLAMDVNGWDLLNPVPEPSQILLICAGLPILAAARNKKRKIFRKSTNCH